MRQERNINLVLKWYNILFARISNELLADVLMYVCMYMYICNPQNDFTRKSKYVQRDPSYVVFAVIILELSNQNNCAYCAFWVAV